MKAYYNRDDMLAFLFSESSPKLVVIDRGFR